MESTPTDTVNEERVQLASSPTDKLNELLAKDPLVMPRTPKPLYDTRIEELPPARYAIAVSSHAITKNRDLHEKGATPQAFMPVIEIYELREDGTLEEARLIRHARHVEILGPSWVYHDPEDVLRHNGRRASVMQTESALRLHVDTTTAQQDRVAWGC